jgi:hypothetical protein
MSSKAYNDHPGLRWSNLSAGVQSGLQLAHERDNGRKDTAALGLGRVVHVAALEPAEVTVQLVPAEHLTPSGALSTGAKTRAWAAECAAVGLEYATLNDAMTGDRIAAALQRHPVAVETLEQCPVREVPVYAVVDGVAGKCCPDLYDPKTGILADLKTHSGRGRFSVRSVVAAMQQYRYAGQMSWYRRVMRAAGLAVEEVRLVFVDTAAPHDVIVVRLSDDWLAYGDSLVDTALANLAAVQSGVVQGVAPAIVEPDLPAWLADTADSSDVDDLGLEGM